MRFLSSFKIKTGGGSLTVSLERYKNIAKLSGSEKQTLKNEINSILIDAWGEFPEDFVEKHIFSENKIFLAKSGDKYIGFCALKKKKLVNEDVHYIEFLVVRRDFQKSGLGSHLFYLTLRDNILKNIIKILFKPLEIMFITPNIRVLSRMSRFASFVYPNPFLSKDDGSIDPADDITWEMAKELIAQSDNPKRVLHREGLVLEDSYVATPWLIYNSNNAPWHHGHDKVNDFARRYLGYNTGVDKEFVVRAHINFLSIIRYLSHSLF